MVFTHAAVGSLVTKELTKNKSLSNKKLSLIYLVGIVGAIFPDLDTILLIFNSELQHRYFITHGILLYLLIFIAFLIIAKIVDSKFVKTLTFAFGLGVLSHLLMDLYYGGIALFSPFVDKLFGFPMEFVFENRLGWARSYLTSGYIIGELAILGLFLINLKSIKNFVGRYLPLIFILISGLMLAVVSFA